jgi:hypothetical protein
MKRRAIFAAFVVSLTCVSTRSVGQTRVGPESRCPDREEGASGMVSTCQVREFTQPFTGSLGVDTGGSGGIAVKGWDRAEVLVRARIQTAASDHSEAEALAQQVIIDAGPAEVRASGPPQWEGRNWSVTYEIFIQHATDVSLETLNGEISITGVHGRIRFRTANGKVVLNAVGGDVEGRTQNGSLSVVLDGDHWEGQQLSIQTSNGGIDLRMPDDYSAHFEVSTGLGRLETDISSLNCRGLLGCSLSFDLGSGGALVRAVTSMGSIRIYRGRERPQPTGRPTPQGS